MTNGLAPDAAPTTSARRLLTVGEALRTVRSLGADAPRAEALLAMSATPGPLVGLCRGYAASLPSPALLLDIHAGSFDDLLGSIELAHGAPIGTLLLVLEWSDFDPRLGWRRVSVHRDDEVADIIGGASQQRDRLVTAIAQLPPGTRVVLAGPLLEPALTVPGRPGELGELRLHLEAALLDVRRAVAARSGGVVIADDGVRAVASRERLSPRGIVATGVPYSLQTQSALARALVVAAFPPPRLKGIITDLDDTLWRGIVGDAGPNGVSWALEDSALPHGWYQRLLATLAAQGVLIGVATRNAEEPVAAALARSDLIVGADRLFPILASWGPKSTSIARILDTWNVGPDAVVFVDDSPLELAEAQTRFPGLHVRRFPTGDPDGVVALIEELSAWSALRHVTADDRLRAGSVRAAAARTAQTGQGEESLEFLRGLHAEVTVDFVSADPDERAFALINKTNQFNVNGARVVHDEWQRLLGDPSSVVAIASYTDRFGPLGRIAVLTGRRDGNVLRVGSWVMSCRAFARRVEHHLLQAVFEACALDALELTVRHTARNGPSMRFLSTLLGAEPSDGMLRLERAQTLSALGELPHRIRLSS
jgi:FkbH-like protein